MNKIVRRLAVLAIVVVAFILVTQGTTSTDLSKHDDVYHEKNNGNFIEILSIGKDSNLLKNRLKPVKGFGQMEMHTGKLPEGALKLFNMESSRYGPKFSLPTINDLFGPINTQQFKDGKDLLIPEDHKTRSIEIGRTKAGPGEPYISFWLDLDYHRYAVFRPIEEKPNN